MNWYLEVMRKYAEFGGRARRKEYWMFVLFNFIIAFAIGFVFGFVGRLLGVSPSVSGAPGMLYALAVLIPGIAVAIRRMHDVGKSGWWILFPIVNLVLACTDSQPGENGYGANPKDA